MVYHPDVVKQIQVAAQVYHGRLNLRAMFKDDLRLTIYPTGMAVMAGTAARVFNMKADGAVTDEEGRWRWALQMRYLGIALFLIPLAVCLAILRNKWGAQTALWTGLLLVLEPVHAQFNHYAMNDAPLAGLMLLSWAMALMMTDEKRIPVYSLLSGFAAGVGFGVKYQGVVGLVFAGVAWLLLTRARGWRMSLCSALAVAGGFAAGILLTCPLIRQDPAYFFSRFSDFMRWQANIMETVIPVSVKLATNLRGLAGLLFPLGHILLFVLAGCGMASALRRGDSVLTGAVFSALLFSAVLFCAVFLARDIIRSNDLIPVYTFSIIACGVLFGKREWAVGRSLPGLYICRGVGAVLAALFVWVSLQDSLALSRVDTRMLAREWCRRNLPLNARVISERYTLPVSRADVAEKRCRFLSEAAGGKEAQAFKGFDYIVTSSLSSRRFFDRGSPYYNEQSRRAYLWIRNNCGKAAEFSDRALWFAHPVVTVYHNRGKENN
jgi:hypothetical protein